MGAIGSRGIHPAQPLLNGYGLPLNTFLSSTRFPPRSLGNQGADVDNLLRTEPKNRAITHLPLVLSRGSLLW